MDSLAFLRPTPLAPLQNPTRSPQPPPLSPSGFRHPRSLRPPTTLSSPRGFGTSPQMVGKNRKRKKRLGFDDKEDDEDDGGGGDDDDGTIPEVVTNRMMRRMGVSIGIPLSLGLLFFPLFYYLKVVGKVDVPSWVPFLVSFFFFGASLLGVSYGIVSASWDPLRDGSFLGWNEARRNWPVFWQSLRGGGGANKK
ncbi:hypothetical protein OPV22_003955 [Ensete ventricosum]|uniref:Protein PAM68, chloroplastic n=1 Tax=Ensete ventricosum TaxID=4639 RepID=A0AAV8S2B9_ENSVE|nr:hypothetical protein OPV22_003955 [Ensete ventricosum]RWW63705.1 hypothetical protein BHE74_00029118 [Ensete ventricosum]